MASFADLKPGDLVRIVSPDGSPAFVTHVQGVCSDSGCLYVADSYYSAETGLMVELEQERWWTDTTCPRLEILTDTDQNEAIAGANEKKQNCFH